ncbi:MAG: HEAT repeat domain-containing protein [Ignavibacteriaceae bacterium]|nr:HEAT repeat domain-containing protein [Ignavibacteriaceae bacterium]
MKTKIFFLLLVISIVCSAQVHITNPVLSHPTSFAIVVDKDTYDKTKDAIVAYRDAVELDGLSTYILVDNWKNPEEIKTELIKLYNSSPKLEGAVFIGNIPIIMIRNGQHMASAFKMDEDRYAWNRSSVSSDRFYDDFDLKFKYLKRDSLNKYIYYYSLLPESPQRIERQIYTARIKPSGTDVDKSDLIRKYLFRVSLQKREQNYIKNSFVFTGHGYNSESLSSWSDEKLSLREQFPQLFIPGGRMKVLDFAMSTEMKEILLTEVQNKDLDFAIFHAHGAEDLQYINNYPLSRNPNENIEAVKLFIRSKIRTAERRKQDVAKAKEYFIKEYNVPANWLDGVFSDSLIKADSLLDYKLDIHIEDVRNISPQAKFIMFDECFNGSYQLDEYMAGEYVFGKGNVIVADANSVNVLQDKWPDEYLGLLNQGVRVGNWHKLRNLIESHLIGDPTFHFSSHSKYDLNKMLVLDNDNLEIWEKLLKSDESVLRDLAVRKVFRLTKEKFETELINIYSSDASFNVRMHALKCLAELNDNAFRQILKISINDPYEFIRRKSTELMGEVGDTSYIPLLAHTILTDESERVSFNGKSSMEYLGALASLKEIETTLNDMPDNVSKEKIKNLLSASFKRSDEWLNKELIPDIFSDTLKLKSRLSQIRTFRNYRFSNGIPELIKLALMKNENTIVRVNTIEALGWYNFSLQKNNIILACNNIINDKTNPDELIQEAIRSKNRLMTGDNDVLLP